MEQEAGNRQGRDISPLRLKKHQNQPRISTDCTNYQTKIGEISENSWLKIIITFGCDNGHSIHQRQIYGEGAAFADTLTFCLHRAAVRFNNGFDNG